MDTPRIATPGNSAFILFGFGGEGGRCLARFASVCALNPSYGMEMLPRTQFVLIDTDIKDLNQTSEQIQSEAKKVPGLVLPPVETISLGRGLDSFEAAVDFDERQYNWANLPDGTPIFDAVWTRPDTANRRRAFRAARAAVPPSRGASQCGMISSYLAMRAMGEFDARLQAIARRVAERGGAEGVRPRLVFVSSLAGGTGRGSWWILAARARRWFPNDRSPQGIFLDASCFESRRAAIGEDQMPRLQVNSLTGFSELAMWLRLVTQEAKAPESAPELTIPAFARPGDVDPHAALYSTRLLCNPTDPTPEGTAGRTRRYPLHRAFVVTGDTDNVRSEPADAAASILTGLLGLADTESFFNNVTDLAGTGMTSVASVPLAELKYGLNRQLRARVLDETLLADHERALVEESVLRQLDGLAHIPVAAAVQTFGNFAQHYLPRSHLGGSGTAAPERGVLAEAIRRLVKACPTGKLRQDLEEQLAAEEVGLSETLWKADPERARAAYAAASQAWMADEVRARLPADADDTFDPSTFQFERWLFDAVVEECRHGEGNRLFSVSVHAHALRQCVTRLQKAKDEAVRQVRELDRLLRAQQESSEGAAKTQSPRDRLRQAVRTVSGRNGTIPIWPSKRYDDAEITSITQQAQHEFVLANLRAVYTLHQARLESLLASFSLAAARAERCERDVKAVAAELHRDAAPALGFDQQGRRTESNGSSRRSTCRILPDDALDRWDWLGREMRALAAQRAQRRFILPVLLRDRSELAKRDALARAAADLGPSVSRLAVESLSLLGCMPMVDRTDGDYLRRAEDLEVEHQKALERALRHRLDALSLVGEDERLFDQNVSLVRVLRTWAQAMAEVQTTPIGPEVSTPIDQDCRLAFGFPLAKAREMGEPGNEAQLLYAFVHRLAQDNDDPVQYLPTPDGATRHDKVSVLVPKMWCPDLASRHLELHPQQEAAAQMDYAKAELHFLPLHSEHLVFATTWSMLDEGTLTGRAWSVWRSFQSYTQPALLREFLPSVDDPAGSSVFEAPKGAVGLGYTAPFMLRRPEFAAHLWRPWAQGMAEPRNRRRSFALLYALLGNAEGLDSNTESVATVQRFLTALGGLEISRNKPALRWTLPILQRNERGQWQLARTPFELLRDRDALDFREPNDARQKQLRATAHGKGPVVLAQDLEKGELDDLVDALLTEHSLLMELARQAPLMNIWNDAVRRQAQSVLRDIVEHRQSQVGTMNEDHARIQQEFHRQLLATLDWLQAQSRGILDPFVP
jgi:hypothetical protein